MSDPQADLGRKVIWREDAAYEEARRRAIWNGRKPERYPAVIVMAESDADVAAAVRLARSRHLKVAVRSGGHSWVASSIRDGGMLIDVSEMNDVSIDATARVASVGPGARSRDFMPALARNGLFFPTGHCPSVAVGGFLLGGGFGWNFRAVGPSCMSVRAVDVVTSEGELIRADESGNSDWLWAARGAGPGFFGAVTRFHLDLYQAPRALTTNTYLYPLDVLEELLTWAREIGASLAPNLEFLIYASAHAAPEQDQPAIMVAGVAFADGEAQARGILAPLETCPVLDRALVREVETSVTFDELYALVGDLYPDGLRYTVDNMYTNAPAAEVVPGMRELFAHMPTPRSHVLWMNWSPGEQLPDMALSVQGDVYIAAYSVWEKDGDNSRCERWGIEQMRRLEPLSVGSQMSDENMAGRPSMYLSPQAAQRLEELRSLHDPTGVFHSFLT